MDRFDLCIIGAGVVGLAVASFLSQSPRYRGLSMVILEQERDIGQHSSSRNSEVIHAGIYYPADSLKARLCVRGKQLLYDYCARHGIAHRRVGKLIVAQSGEEQALEALLERARGNGVDDLKWLQGDQLQAMEAAIKGSAALLSPSSGIIDSHEYMRSLLLQAQQAGAVYAPLTRLERLHLTGGQFRLDTRIETGPTPEHYSFLAGRVINCAGLSANSIAAMIAGQISRHPAVPKLHYCRGDYYSYTGPIKLQRLVYPLPETNTRGLGVHATLDLGGQIRFGPDTTYIDEIDYRPHTGKAKQFAAAAANYLPGIRAAELQPAYAGIRPKLAGPGEAAADFLIMPVNESGQGSLVHLLGIESPGLTASLALAEEVTRHLNI